MDGSRFRIFPAYDLDWLNYVVDCRQGKDCSLEYDIVEGGVANDNVIDTVEDYEKGIITAEQALGQLQYKNAVGYYSNRHRVNLGAEFFPAVLNKGHNPSYLERCRYRIGAFYSSPYLKVNYTDGGTPQDGPTEYGVTAGVGLPITNRINNRSTINVSFQWLRRQPSSTRLITENYYMIHVGVSFNERWFMKYKIE